MEIRASFVKGAGGVIERSEDRVGARPDASILEFVGTSLERPGDELSGLAMIKPPNDCDRLRSFSIALSRSSNGA